MKRTQELHRKLEFANCIRFGDKISEQLEFISEETGFIESDIWREAVNSLYALLREQKKTA